MDVEGLDCVLTEANITQLESGLEMAKERQPIRFDVYNRDVMMLIRKIQSCYAFASDCFSLLPEEERRRIIKKHTT